MAVEEDDGYRLHLGSSTTTFFLEEDDGSPDIIERHPIRRPLFPTTHPLPTVCSSSRGLIACRDPTSNYFVGNPFLEGPNAYIPLPRTPRTHQSTKTCVVLATDLSTPAFYLVCAVCEREGIYTFDVFSSITNKWLYDPQQRHVPGGDILAETGVSWGRTACWLIRRMGQIAEVAVYNIMEKRIDQYLPLPHPLNVLLNCMMQLGRVGDNLGLVIVSKIPEAKIEVQIRNNGEWQPLAFINLDLRPESSNWFCRGEKDQKFYPKMNGNKLILKEMPQPLRFESFKMDLLFLMDGWFLIWEDNDAYPLCHRAKLVRVDRNMPAHSAEAIPHVCTSSLPLSFFNQL